MVNKAKLGFLNLNWCFLLFFIIIMLHVTCEAGCIVRKLQENEMLNMFNASKFCLNKMSLLSSTLYSWTKFLFSKVLLAAHIQSVDVDSKCRCGLAGSSLEIFWPQLDKSLQNLIHAGCALSSDWTRWPPESSPDLNKSVICDQKELTYKVYVICML